MNMLSVKRLIQIISIIREKTESGLDIGYFEVFS
jgi:hypothetical protein